MFVQEMLAPPDLVLVYQTTEFDVLDCLRLPPEEVVHPAVLVPVRLDVQFLQKAEECAWRRADHNKWVLFLDLLPSSLPVFWFGKVVTVGEIH